MGSDAEEERPNIPQTNAARDSRRLGALARPTVPEHLCAICETAEEYLAVAIPFVRDGLDRGEKCIYVVDDGGEDLVRAAMASEGIDVGRAVETGQLVLLSNGAYLRDDAFDPESMLTFWADAASEATRRGFSALRVTGETEWMLRGRPERERWREYEIGLTRMLARNDCSILCRYSRSLCPPEIVLDAMHTHPTILYRGAACRNMYYVPPEELFGRDGAERGVARLLHSIREREEVESSLTSQRDELRGREACLTEAQRISHTGCWTWNLESGRMFWSSEHFRLHDIEPSLGVISPELLFERMHPDDRAASRRALEEAVARRSELEYDYRVVRPDGTIRHIHSIARPMTSDDGSPFEYIGTAVEVTERRRSEAALRASEARFREIAENIREVFWVWDVDADRVSFVSPTYEDVFGRSCASLYASFSSFLDAIHPDDRVRVEAAVRCSRGGMPTDEQYRVIRPDGSMRWVRDRAFPVPETTGPVRRVVGVADDITERKDAEDGLQRSEGLLRLVLDALPVGVAVVDRSGDIILGNPASRRIWAGAVRSGAERYAESKGWWHDTGEILAPEDWASARALSTGEISVNEVIDIQAFDGVRKTLHNSAVPIRDAGGAITGAVVVNEDISASEAAERALKDSYGQMRTLTGRLMRAQDDERRRIAQMLHETTAQDLAALKMLLGRLVRTSAGLGESERGILAESVSVADRTMTEIRTLSYLLHPPFLDETGLLPALRWYAAGFAKRSGIKVDLDLPETFSRLPSDTETALFRVVQESLINIHRHAASEMARLRLRADDETLTLQIDDWGHGIPSASLEQILAGGGTAGVGIAGMSERIKQLGGRLDILSEGRGTTVRAVLPLPKARV
jgi:PAS domain S-box-containing protein